MEELILIARRLQSMGFSFSGFQTKNICSSNINEEEEVEDDHGN